MINGIKTCLCARKVGSTRGMCPAIKNRIDAERYALISISRTCEILRRGVISINVIVRKCTSRCTRRTSTTSHTIIAGSTSRTSRFRKTNISFGTCTAGDPGGSSWTCIASRPYKSGGTSGSIISCGTGGSRITCRAGGAYVACGSSRSCGTCSPAPGPIGL